MDVPHLMSFALRAGELLKCQYPSYLYDFPLQSCFQTGHNLDMGGAAMTPLVKTERDAEVCMANRRMFLDKPLEFYSQFFNGRVPSMEEALFYIEGCVQRMMAANQYENDTYFVQVFSRTPFYQINIRRKDGQACKSWWDFQQIKNEVLGPGYEAVELYPADDRLIDTSNEYHLWAFAKSDYRFPFGFNRRVVLSEQERFGSNSRQLTGSTDSAS
jgi:hypothetical protein